MSIVALLIVVACISMTFALLVMALLMTFALVEILVKSLPRL